MWALKFIFVPYATLVLTNVLIGQILVSKTYHRAINPSLSLEERQKIYDVSRRLEDSLSSSFFDPLWTLSKEFKEAKKVWSQY